MSELSNQFPNTSKRTYNIDEPFSAFTTFSIVDFPFCIQFSLLINFGWLRRLLINLIKGTFKKKTKLSSFRIRKGILLEDYYFGVDVWWMFAYLWKKKVRGNQKFIERKFRHRIFPRTCETAKRKQSCKIKVYAQYIASKNYRCEY